jgi:predicted PurR-regulated permease PerM
MTDEYTRNVIIALLLIVMVVITFFLINPILKSVLIGMLLAFVFNPLYKILLKYVKSRTLSSIIICLFAFLIIIIPFILLAPSVIDQSFEVFKASQEVDFPALLQKLFPALFSSEVIAQETSNAVKNLIVETTNSFIHGLSDILINLPNIFIQLVIIFFTFYFFMKEQEDVAKYLTSVSPFSRETEKRFVEQSKAITNSVIYGQFIIGIVQGILTGLGMFVFGVPNALFLTIIAIIAGVFPIIGPAIVWIPAMIYLFLIGNNFAGFGLLAIGIIASLLENILRPLFVSKRTNIPSSLILVGMIGGFFLIGVIGFVMGPLILAYLIILLDVFKGTRLKNPLLKEEQKS